MNKDELDPMPPNLRRHEVVPETNVAGLLGNDGHEAMVLRSVYGKDRLADMLVRERSANRALVLSLWTENERLKEMLAQVMAVNDEKPEE